MGQAHADGGCEIDRECLQKLLLRLEEVDRSSVSKVSASQVRYVALQLLTRSTQAFSLPSAEACVQMCVDMRVRLVSWCYVLLNQVRDHVSHGWTSSVAF